MIPSAEVSRLGKFLGLNLLEVKYGPYQGGDWLARFGGQGDDQLIGHAFGLDPEAALAGLLPDLRKEATRELAKVHASIDGVAELLAKVSP